LEENNKEEDLIRREAENPPKFTLIGKAKKSTFLREKFFLPPRQFLREEKKTAGREEEKAVKLCRRAFHLFPRERADDFVRHQRKEIPLLFLPQGCLLISSSANFSSSFFRESVRSAFFIGP